MRDEKGRFQKGSKKTSKIKEKISKNMQGNTNGTKLKDPEFRKLAYKQYCDWISAGKSKESWKFIHPEDPLKSLTSKTMERYIREFPTEFPIIHKEVAEAYSFECWEQRGIDMLNGKQKHCQPAIYQMFMRNKFGWDKESQISHSVEPEVRQLLKYWKNQ